MSVLRFSSIILSVCFIFTTTGCKDHLLAGHYEGNLLKKIESGYTTTPVHIDITYSSPSKGTLQIKNQQGNKITSIQVSATHKNHLTLNAPTFGIGPIELSKVALKNNIEKFQCYNYHSNVNVELCFNENQIYLKFMDKDFSPLCTLSGNSFTDENEFSLEPPQNISLLKAIDQAFESNYDSRIALKHVVQARNSAIAAWLNLLPHLTSNLIWNASPSYISAVATVQSLAPFLLPTYWLQAKEASINVKIKKDAQLITQADLVSILEQQFYTFERDSNISQTHQFVLDHLDTFQNGLLEKVQSNPVSKDLFDMSTSLIDLVKSTQSGVDRVLKEERFGISQALGFHNPNAIQSITIGEELLPIEKASLIEDKPLAEWAMSRSFELQQMDYMIQIGNLKEIELYFTWIDPAGDPKSGFGFNLIGQVKVSKSQIEELKLMREQLKSITYQNAYRIALDYNQALESYQMNKIAPDQAQPHFVTLLNQALSEDSVPAHSIKSSIQEYLSDRIRWETNLAAFRVARAKKDRLLLAGYYERLLPQLPLFDPQIITQGITY